MPARKKMPEPAKKKMPEPAKNKMSEAEAYAHMQQIIHRKQMLGPNPFPFREKKFAEESTKELRKEQKMQQSKLMAGPSRSEILREQAFAARTKELKARGTQSSSTRKLIK